MIGSLEPDLPRKQLGVHVEAKLHQGRARARAAKHKEDRFGQRRRGDRKLGVHRAARATSCSTLAHLTSLLHGRLTLDDALGGLG